MRGLRITPESVDTMTTSREEALAESDSPACVVYQLFKNSSYFCLKLDGSRVLAEKGRDGKFHVPESLEPANKDDIKRTVTTAIPLLRAAGMNKKIVLTPLEIYYRINAMITRATSTTLATPITSK
jgi:hypothetical protein